MVKSFENLNKAETEVFQSVTLNLAATVCDQLEKAGYSACLGKVTSGFAVMVPFEFAAQTRGLLTGQPGNHEILFKIKKRHKERI